MRRQRWHPDHCKHLGKLPICAAVLCCRKCFPTFDKKSDFARETITKAESDIGLFLQVEDLFYNISTRRKALKAPSEEHNRICEVVSRYAIHNPAVAFSLKKVCVSSRARVWPACPVSSAHLSSSLLHPQHGETTSDVRTVGDSTSSDNIRAIYGASVAR